MITISLSESMTKICIIDYGVGNLHSALKAVQLFSEDASMSNDPEEIQNADGLVLPGVGSYEAGMHGLRERKLITLVKEATKNNKPILGICLGAQLLMSKGFEFGTHDGLDSIPGEVRHFPGISERVPHMGWNEIIPACAWENTILDGIGESEMYFVHSYVMQPADNNHTLATTEYGGHTFVSAMKKGNTYGCQFHPEKSGKTGLKIIENFVRLVEEHRKSQ